MMSYSVIGPASPHRRCARAPLKDRDVDRLGLTSEAGGNQLGEPTRTIAHGRLEPVERFGGNRDHFVRSEAVTPKRLEAHGRPVLRHFLHFRR